MRIGKIKTVIVYLLRTWLGGNKKMRSISELVTIVVPVYNVENYLSRCIQTLERQIYDNLEIIFIDDGSTDNSKTIIEQYMELSLIHI